MRAGSRTEMKSEPVGRPHKRWPPRRRLPSVRTRDVLKSLEENSLDIGLATLPAPGRMFEVTAVLEDAFVAIAASDGDALPDVVTPGVLAELPVILYEAGGNTRRIVDQWFA